MDVVKTEGRCYILNRGQLGTGIGILIGFSALELSQRLCISQPTAGQSVKRDKTVVEKKNSR